MATSHSAEEMRVDEIVADEIVADEIVADKNRTTRISKPSDPLTLNTFLRPESGVTNLKGLFSANVPETPEI